MKIAKPAWADRIRLRDVYYNFDKSKCLLPKLLNDIFENGEIPKGSKYSIVCPVYKTGKKKGPNNYRPISILPVVFHIMEKFIAHVMTSFCDTFSLISGSQYGFRKKRGARDLLEIFSDIMSQSIEKNRISLALFLDLPKAFDTVDHYLLLDKPRALGFRGPFYKLLSN